MNESTHVFHNASVPSIKRVELWRFISLGVGLVKEFLLEWGILRELLGDPRELLPFLFKKGINSCQCEILGVGSFFYC